MKQKPLNPFLLWFTKITGAPAAFLFFKPKVYYVDRRQQSRALKRPCILMSNHKSLLDFALYLCLFFTRTIRFLMAEVLFRKNALFSWFLFGLGGIYVNRDTYNFDFMNESVKVLQDGGIVGIFPESRLPVNGKPWPFKPSVAYIALRAGAPIVPVYTDGNYGLFKRARVVIGTPIRLTDYYRGKEPDAEEVRALVGVLEEKMSELKEYLKAHGK